MWGKETRKCKFMTLLSKRLAWVLGHSKVLFTVLLITSLYAILVIELEALPPMKINRSEEFVKGLNRIFLGLSYSYVVGIIVFWFTVIWPARHEKYRLRPVINKKIENIGTMLEYMITGFPLKEGQSFVDLKDLEGCRNLLKSADWNKKNALGHILMAGINYTKRSLTISGIFSPISQNSSRATSNNWILNRCCTWRPSITRSL